MEKFVINEYGSLTAYHNDDKNITEITVPDGVKHISHYVFGRYKKIDVVTLPESLKYIEYSSFLNSPFSPVETNVSIIKYRGVNFNPRFEHMHIDEVIDMIASKDYSKKFSHVLKYPVVLQIYFNDSDDVTTAYIKKNFKKFFMFLTDAVIFESNCGLRSFGLEYMESAAEILEKLIKSGKFITKRNINNYIAYADEHECYEIFDILNEYKEEVLK